MNVLGAAEEMWLRAGLPVFALPNAGIPRRVDDRMVYVSTPEYFGVYARRMFKLGVSAIGGCCGTTPDHVRRIAAAARHGRRGPRRSATTAACKTGSDLDRGRSQVRRRSRRRARRGHSIYRPRAKQLPVAVQRDRCRARPARASGKKFLVSVEVNPPIGLDPEKAVRAARMLKEGGVDVINIADGARAQARMSNIAMAVRVQNDAGIETILHVCGPRPKLAPARSRTCSRRTILRPQEPGHHHRRPAEDGATSRTPPRSTIFDSIGILKLAWRLNHGVDPGGKPLGATTGFVLATGAEPAALYYLRASLARLKQ